MFMHACQCMTVGLTEASCEGKDVGREKRTAAVVAEVAQICCICCVEMWCLCNRNCSIYSHTEFAGRKHTQHHPWKKNGRFWFFSPVFSKFQNRVPSTLQLLHGYGSESAMFFFEAGCKFHGGRVLFSSNDMSSKRLQTLPKMQQNHQKSVQTLVDGAICWVHGHSPNHSRWNKIWNFDHVHLSESNIPVVPHKAVAEVSRRGKL